MSRPVALLPAFSLLTLFAVGSTLRADDLEGLAARVRETDEVRATAEKAHGEAEQQAVAATQRVDKLEADLAAAQKTEKGADESLKQEKAKVDAAKAAAEKARADLDAKQKAADAAKGSDGEKAAADAAKAAEQAATKANEAVAAAEKAVEELATSISRARKTVAEAPAQIEAAKKEAETTRATEVERRAALDEATATWIAARKAHERALIDAGQLVSFAESVAPILNSRCVACHNARSAKGRFNLATFAALEKGGESGIAIDRETPEFSNLLAVLEDESMPKDADPLTKEQIAVIAKWLETGARLDAGLDPHAPLVTIVPKAAYPQPPESYRVPIPVTALAFSPDGKLLATSGYHEVLLYDAATGELVRRIPNVAQRVHDLAFTADGTQLAVAAGTPAQIGEARLFDVATGELVRDFLTTTDAVFAVSFDPEGKRLVTAGADRAIRVHDVATGETLVTIEDHADWVMDVAWSPDGTLLVSASRDKTAKVFDAATGDSRVTFNGHAQPVYAAAFTPDGKQAVTAGADKQVRIWNVGDAKEARKIGGFGGEIFGMTVATNGQVFTASSDKSARQHGLDGKAVRTFTGHGDWVYAVARDAAGERIATAGYDGEVRIWKVADGTSLTTFVAAPGLPAGSE